MQITTGFYGTPPWEVIDIGINLMHRQFAEDRMGVIKRAQQQGVSAMIITGTSVRSSRQAADYAAKFPGMLYATAGVHPHDAKSCTGDTISQLKTLCRQKQVVAVGECGLDYDRDFSPQPIQKKWFEAQIQLAEELDMPLFLHERAAFKDFYELLSGHPDRCSRAVVHCFTGSRKELEAYLALGCYIGITGWICDERRGKMLRELVPLIPEDKLMIETDGPFLIPRNLTPRPENNRNEPQYLNHIADEIARIRHMDTGDLAKSTTENARRFFNLS